MNFTYLHRSTLRNKTKQKDIALQEMHYLKEGRFCLCGLIVRVRVVPRRTVVGDIDRRFDNLSGRHHQSHGRRVEKKNDNDSPKYEQHLCRMSLRCHR